MNKKTNTTTKIKAKLVVIAVITLIFVTCLGYASFYLAYYLPADAQITASLDTYDYTEEQHWFLFQGDKNNENDAIFIFPNPRVDEKAYFYFASGLQKKGYNVFLGKSLFHQPILSSNLVSKAKEQYPAHTSWIIGGHLEGNNAVTKHLLKNRETTRAVFYLGNVPDKKAFETDKPILIVLGSVDSLTSDEKLLQQQAIQNSNVSLNIIDGASSTGFGFYKNKKEDATTAKINRNEQQDATVERLDKFIKSDAGTTSN